MSTVLPWERAVVRATPGIFGPCVIDGCDNSSSSVSGYGEKYLKARMNNDGAVARQEQTHQVFICQSPKCTVSKLRCAVICLCCCRSMSSSVIGGSSCTGWVSSLCEPSLLDVGVYRFRFLEVPSYLSGTSSASLQSASSTHSSSLLSWLM